MKYRVLWQQLWKNLTKYISIAVSVPILFVFIARFFQLDMNLDKTFEHISMLEMPLLFLAIWGCSAVLALVCALLIKFAAVEIRDGHLIGRNYWYFKHSIPIASIYQLYHFSDNGIDAIVADGGVHGKVYISTHTEELEELIDYLQKHSLVGDSSLER